MNLLPKTFFMEATTLKTYLMDKVSKVAWILENASIHVKLFVSFTIGIITSPIGYFVERIFPIIFPSGDFPLVMAVIITVDWITGMWKWWKRHKFDWRAMAIGLWTKIAITYMGMVLFQGLGYIDEFANHPDIKSYFMLVGKMTVFFYVAGSAFNNMYYVTEGRFPPLGWMKRMKAFEETADTRVFTEGIKETPEEN